MSQKKILIITAPQNPASLVNSLTKCWLKSGYDVKFISPQHMDDLDADIIFIHIDTTNVPRRILELSKQYPNIINGTAESISKELFSKQLVSLNSEYNGEVIVKTKSNYGGLPELHGGRFSRIKRKFAGLIRKMALSDLINSHHIKHLLWKNLRILDPGNYPLFDSISDVPSGVWENPKLIVEKYLPELDSEGRYVLRHWYFFGDKEFNRTLVSSKSPIKWSSMNQDERELSVQEWNKINICTQADIPDEVREVRKKLKMDFGRIDWAFHNGTAVVFDANKTPTLSVGSMQLETDLNRRRESLLCEFSEGLEYYI